MTAYYTEHRAIIVAVDCIVFGYEPGALKVLIGRRRFEPGAGSWSLYGGFVRPDEDLDAAARRTLREATGLASPYMEQVGAFGRTDRDPGGRVISVAYLALIDLRAYQPEQLEHYQLRWTPVSELPPLFADHSEMVRQALAALHRRMAREPVAFHLLPERFSLTQLQQLYEAAAGRELDKRNFRKRIKELPCIAPTGVIDKTFSRRGAMLYRFDAAACQPGTFSL